MSHWDAKVDARELLCSLPVLRARKVLVGMAPGAVLRVLASDPMAVVDLPYFCIEAGRGFLDTSEVEEGQAYLIRRG